jgi:MFS family permease
MFRRYFIGQALSAFGSALSSVALAFAVISLNHSASALGIVLTASRLPQILFALLGGALGDRFSRRHVLLVTDAVRAGLQTLTAAVLILHVADLAVIAALQTITGIGSALFGPAANGLIKELAPCGRNREATSLLAMATNGVAISGLAAAGVLVGLVGPGVAFAIDGATFAASAISLALIKSPSLTTLAASPLGLLHDVSDGWRSVRAERWLLVHCAHVCFINAIALSPFFVLGPLLASRSLGGAPAWAAIAIAWTVGSIVSNVAATKWAPRRPIATAIALTLGLIPLLTSLAVNPKLMIVLPAALIAGAESALSNTIVLVALQDHIPDHLLARATSFESIGSLIAVPLGMGVCGVAAAITSTQTVFAFGAFWVLMSTGAALASPAVRQLGSPTSTSYQPIALPSQAHGGAAAPADGRSGGARS